MFAVAGQKHFQQMMMSSGDGALRTTLEGSVSSFIHGILFQMLEIITFQTKDERWQRLISELTQNNATLIRDNERMACKIQVHFGLFELEKYS